MNAGRQRRATAVVTPGVATTGFAGRLRAAWRVLRDGPAAPLPADTVEVTRAEALEKLGLAFAAFGFDTSWPISATSEEIDGLCSAVSFVAEIRDQDWLAVEAGRWPR